MSTFLDLATDAITELGQLGIGQSLSPEEAAQALRYANRMIAKWSLQRLMLFTINTRVFLLTAGQQDYTVGPTGANFTGTRPTFVEAAQAQLVGTNVDHAVDILDKIAWGAIRDKGAVSSAAGVCSDVWPEYTYPNLTFHVYPVPGVAYNLKLGTWEQLQQFVTVFDTVNFPPGYEEAIVHNLAMELASLYDMPVNQALQQLAADGLIQIQRINAKTLGSAYGEVRTLAAPNLDSPAPEGQQAPPQPAQ